MHKSTEDFITYVEKAAEASLLDEVKATPKPGLVDLNNSGAHRDMDYHTFYNSTKAIAPFIARMAALGALWHCPEDTEGLFRSIRPVGMEAEAAMFRATDGVNTHKGMIFSMGLVAAAAGLLFQREQKPLQAEKILALCGEMCRGPLGEDFASISQESPRTHGERLYLQYGCRGIRGEAALGFPSLSGCALPALRECLAEINDGDHNRLCLQILLRLMARVDDTNVLFRTDYASLLYVKEEAARILLLGGSYTEEGIKALWALNEDFTRRNISPGGCADLLAITLFLWRLEACIPDRRPCGE